MAVKTNSGSKNIWTLLIVGGAIYYFFFYDSGSNNTTATHRANAIAAASTAMLDDEKSFLAIVSSFKGNFENQPNDMLKARERRSRKTALCQLSRVIKKTGLEPYQQSAPTVMVKAFLALQSQTM